MVSGLITQPSLGDFQVTRSSICLSSLVAIFLIPREESQNIAV